MLVVILHNHPIHYKHLLFQEMVKLNLDFTVLFGGTQSNIRSEGVLLSQDLYKYQFISNGPVEAASAAPQIFATLRALRKLKPQVLISAGYERPECWAGWFWALFHRVPVILWYESNRFDWPRRWWKELPKRLFMQGLAGAHVYGLTNREYLVHLGLEASRILIKRAVVDVARFDLPSEQKKYRGDGTTNLLYIGRLSPEKNLPFLIEAFAAASELTNNRLYLTIVGSGPQEQAIRSLIDRLNVSKLVSLKGYVQQAALAPFLLDADFFVLPSIREPWGLVALEAMLSRMPVLISSQCGCAADLIAPDTGWAFSPWDSSQLTQLVSRLPDIPIDRLRFMGNAAHDVACRYTPENSAKAIAESIRLLPLFSDRLTT